MLTDHYITGKLWEPPEMASREFGFMVRRNGGRNGDTKMYRHFSFTNEREVRLKALELGAADIFFSTAVWTFPDAKSMEKKRWNGANLVFDIDCDHLDPPTLREAWRQVVALCRVLRDDFGFEKILIAFSGNRGYHLHVYDEGPGGKVLKLGPAERREIVDYIADRGIHVDAQVTCDVHRLIRLPGSVHGKRGKICEIVYSTL
ncbi:MAG: DNA primase small subunit domain-containing protein [Candidatus Syntropharchaeia archaeon]